MSPRILRPRGVAALRPLLGAGVLAFLTGCAGAAAPASSPAPAGPDYVVYDLDGAPVDGLPVLVESLAAADVVFVGEQHTDAVAHRFELDLLRELSGGTRPVVVALEMFERDAQPALDAYLSGDFSEEEFLEQSRPWPTYAADYRPLVELAREQGWPVVGSNVPRPFAAAVAQVGLGILDELEPHERALAAESIRCPEDAYFERFSAEMTRHGGAHGSADAGDTASMIRRLYEAQCLKDETMAESILAARTPGSLVVHFNGAFHSDEGMGIVPRVQRRSGRLEVVIVSLVPVPDPRDRTAVERLSGRADFLVLTRADPRRER